MDVRLLIVVYLMVCVAQIATSPYRSRKRNSLPTFDQKQTGEYNIRLHLKDFEVVALLSDSAFGEFGDYDYSYDYSDLTIKPGLFGSTTKKPTTPVTTHLPTTLVTFVPNATITSTEPKLTTLNQSSPPSTEQPVLSSTKPPEPIEVENLTETTTKSGLFQSILASVMVMKPVDNATVVSEQLNQEEEVLPVVVHRKCSNGFTRDKLGRCRRVRRPAPPFSLGFSRLATLASKLRRNNESAESASTENSSEE